MARLNFGVPAAVIVGGLIALACSDEKTGPIEPGRIVVPATLESDLKEYCDALFPGTNKRTSERRACAGKVESAIKHCVQKENPDSCQDQITALRMFTDDLFEQLLDPPYPPLPTAEGGDETFTSKVLAVNEFYELLNLTGDPSGAEGGDQAVVGPGDETTLDCGIGTLHIPMGTVDEPTLFQCTPLEGLNLNTTLPQFVFQMDASSNPAGDFNEEVEVCLTHLDPPDEGSPPADALERLRVALDGFEFTIATPGTGDFCPTSEGLNAASPGEVSGKLSKLRSPTGIVDPGFAVENQDGIVVEGFVDNGEPFQVGETITYRVVVTNETSGTTMTNMVADLSLVSGGTIVACDAVRDGFPTQGSVTTDDCTGNEGSGAGLTWAIGTLLPGESAEIQYDATAVADGTDTNRVVVTSDHFEGVHVTDEETVVEEAVGVDLSIENDDGTLNDGVFDPTTEIFFEGDLFYYRVRITNTGGTLTNVVVTDLLLVDPAGDPTAEIPLECRMIRSGFPTSGSVTASECLDQGEGADGSGFTWTIGTLSSEAIVEIQFQVEAFNGSEGDHLNRVTVTADQIDGSIVDEEPTTVTVFIIG